MGGIITFVKKVGERFAGVIRAAVKPVIPELYIERMAARRVQRKKFAAEALKDAKRAAAGALKTEARARIALKTYKRKIDELKEYGLGTTYSARMQRRRLRRKELAAGEAVSKAKRELKKRTRDYVVFLKKKTFKEREWRRKWKKTADEIKYEIETPFSYQTVVSARFMCPERTHPTKELEGYSKVRFTRHNKPSISEQNEMREEAIGWIIGAYLDGNSECEPIEDTIKVELRRRDLKKEGEMMRKKRLDKIAAKKQKKKK